MIDFLIVGAAKAGTTALFNLLAQSSEVLDVEVKEPRYFLKDYISKISDDDPQKDHLIKSSILDSSLYFKKYHSKEKFVGEASVHYLFNYEKAIPNIKKHNPNIKIIILLREPVQRLISNYNYLKRLHNNSLEDELKHEYLRKKNNYNSFWFYKSQGKYYKQVKEYLSTFNEVEIIFYEDLKLYPLKTTNKVLNFIGAKPLPKIKNKNFNPSFEPNIFFYFFRRIKFLKSFLPISIYKFLKDLTLKKVKQEENEFIKFSLEKYFENSNLELSKLLKRELPWAKGK